METSPGKGEYDGEMFSDPSPCETSLLHSLTLFEFHLPWLAYCAAIQYSSQHGVPDVSEKVVRSVFLLF